MRETPVVAALRTWSRRPAAQDTALALALLALCLLTHEPWATAGRPADPMAADERTGEDLLWWTATTLGLSAVALRRRRPVPMLGLASLSAATHLAGGWPLMTVDACVPVLLYTVAARHSRMVSLAALAALLLLATGLSLQDARPTFGPTDVARAPAAAPVEGGLDPAAGQEESPPVHRSSWPGPWSDLSILGSFLVASWAVGSGARNRRAYQDELRARAQDLERERDQRAALAVAAERGRISRELHDVVAHGLSVMVIQAQGGAAALHDRPADTQTALEAVVAIGRDSLAEMRRVLAAVGEVDDAWHPQPGIARLGPLIDQVRSAGMTVRLRVEGRPADLPPAVDLSAYRIVQEALTNTMKHASAGAAADVLLSYGDTELGIEVGDDSRGGTRGTDTDTDGGGDDDDGGNGLRGMRERVRLLGGRLATGPGPHGGFVVRATLPLQGSDG